jgi:putative transcriptional regulator
MQKETWLTNHFLIAMPTLKDPNFFHSVTYICEHNEHGAMGIVINQPVDLILGDLADQLKFENTDEVALLQPIYRGGPVDNERGFVLHRPVGQWDSTLDITTDIGISTSHDIVTALASGKGPHDSLIALGYAGWGAGQLEQELADNAWLSGPADARIIFETRPNQRWVEAARLLGIDINNVSGEIGHA